MKVLLLAEKPSVARAIEEVYRQNRAEFKHDIVFTSFHGHLMGLKKPAEYDAKWEKWDKDHLPILPDKLEYKEIDVKSCKALMSMIKSGGYEALINACDAGQEGELIFWSFYKAEGLKLPVMRYWASSNAKGAIKAALKDPKPSRDFAGLRKAAFLRAEFDWKVGMNLSRAASLAFGTIMAVGRVKTPVLKIIADREKEILNFKEESFFEVKASLKKQGFEPFTAELLVLPGKETKFVTKDEAKKHYLGLGSKATVKDVKTEDKTTPAPVLLNTADLQKEANKAFKFSADKTLEIAQNLYENGYITYPRTNARYLPAALVPEIPGYVKALETHPDYGKFAKAATAAVISSILSTKQYVDDGKIEDHHAIITTDEAVDLTKLTKDERLIYDLVARRFLAIFMSPLRFQRVAVLFTSGTEYLKVTGQTVVDKGWTEILGEKKDIILPPLSKGDVLSIEKKGVSEGKTQPPKRYTPSTILSAMENAGSFVEDKAQKKALRAAEGIGTAATRAGILKDLVDRNYLSIEKNYYIPSKITMETSEIFEGREFASPALTAIWQEKLLKIQDGDKTDITPEIDDYIVREIADIFSSAKDLSSLRFPEIGSCPVCGKPVRAKKNYFVCDGYKAGCMFIFDKIVLSSSLSDKDGEKLLKGETLPERKLKKKDGTEFKAKLVLIKGDDGSYKIGFSKESSALGKCPVCGKAVLEGQNSYFCKGAAEKTCEFSLGKRILEADITKKDVKSLLSGESVTKSFTYRNGNKGDASISIDSSGKLNFSFSKG